MSAINEIDIVNDIRSGTGDEAIMRKYSLSRRGLAGILITLVNDRAVAHNLVYEKSETYRAIADVLIARQAPRVYAPIAVKITKGDTSKRGFLRDISYQGVRVAGIEATVGEEVTISLPLKKLIGAVPLKFKATCRWSGRQGKTKTYPVSGFEVTAIASDDQDLFYLLIEFLRHLDPGPQRTFYSPLNVPEASKAAENAEQ